MKGQICISHGDVQDGIEKKSDAQKGREMWDEGFIEQSGDHIYPPYVAPPAYKSSLTFSQGFKRTGKKNFLKFIEIFRKVHINISLVKAFQQMSSYAKFINDIILKKMIDWKNLKRLT